ncbi:hypothetical protein HOLleu_39335 [Holothuria leucospilota]|uniref:CUB domain-containing protein n=1 Tax=Holothuria leucospilota TaxID=206669 RepID=A0A9Q1BE98_HOLLE|nr:hypothetical protein HOLleu_39335 [Holothuria leucospilota]
MKIPPFAFIAFCCHLTLGEENWKFVFTSTISSYRLRNHFYALQRKNVSLICKHTYGSENCSTLNVYKGIDQENALAIVGDGRLMTTTSARYSMSLGDEGGQRRCKLFMYDVRKSDSSPYVCSSLQIMGNMSARVVSNLADLLVVEQRDPPNFCDLISGVEGVFFTGDDLTLRCPNRSKLKIKFKKRDGRDLRELDYHTCVPMDDHFCSLSVENMNANLNGSSVSCTDGAGRDFCEHIPQIRVFDDLTVFIDFLEWNEKELYVTVACRSIPSLLSPVEWEIFGTNVTMERREDLHQLRINFKNLSKEMEIELEVSCEIQIGTKSSKTLAVYGSTSFTSVQTPLDVTTPFNKLSTVGLQRKGTTQGTPIYAISIGCVVTVFIILVVIFFFVIKGRKKKKEIQFPAKESTEAAEQDGYYGNVESISCHIMQARNVNANTYSNVPKTIDCSETNESFYQNCSSPKM